MMVGKRNFVKIVVVCVVFSLVIILYLFVLLWSPNVSSDRGREDNIKRKEEFNEYSHKSYQLVRYNRLSQTSYHEIIKHHEMKDHYEYFEDSDSLTLISALGSSEYLCSGICFCESENNHHNRRISSIPFFSKEVITLVGAMSSILAIHYAKDYFNEKCLNEYLLESASDCPHEKILSEVIDCEQLYLWDSNERKPKLEEGNFYTVDELIELGYVKESEVIRESAKEEENEIIEIENENGIIVYTDGACKANGRENARAGVGVFFGSLEDERNIGRRLPGKPQTNNRAELTAILDALNSVGDDEDLEIRSDSTYAIKVSTGQNKAHTNLDIVDEIKKRIRERKGKTGFVNVKGHTGLQDGNYYADMLANKGCEMEEVD